MEYTDGTIEFKNISLQTVWDKINALQELLDNGEIPMRPTKALKVKTENITANNTWFNDSFVAPKTGWYTLYVSNISGTPSAFIKNNITLESRANGNGSRDFATGLIWAKAGETILYGTVYVGTRTIWCYYRD